MRRAQRQHWIAVLALSIGACRASLTPVDTPLASGCTLSVEPAAPSGARALLHFTTAVAATDCELFTAARWLAPWPDDAGGPWTVAASPSASHSLALRRLAPHAARDILDAGDFSAIATEDQDLLAYASAIPTLSVSPLPWTRHYLLVSRDRRPFELPIDSTTVRAASRLAPALAPCLTSAQATAPPADHTGRITYRQGDRTAQEIAERFAAVHRLRAVGLASQALESALGAGSESAYVVSVASATSCAEWTRLSSRATWLTTSHVRSLIETRTFAIRPRR